MGKKSFALLLLLLSGMVYPLSSYDQPCTITSDCVLGLACDPQSQRCTQEATGPFGRCDNTELPYAFDNSVFTGSAVGGPGQYISEQEGGTGGALVQNTSGFYSWFYDWRVTGAIGLAIAVAIIALAAMFGHGFNLPEVKAFVDTELMQAIVSALLLVSIIAIITFTDQLSRAAVDASGLPVSCNPSEPCYVSVAKAYLANLYDVSNGYAKERFGEQLRKQSAASFGISTQLNFWLLLFAGASFRPNAGESMDAERAGTIFETTTKLMASLYAQRYFIDVVSFGIAPIFLLLGILLRTFFFTRKLGGLLLAIALALFIVYPLTYAFAWFTLNVTIYGDRTFGPEFDPSCPLECTARYPVAFYVEDGTGGTQSGRIRQFETSQDLLRAGITKDNWISGDVNGDGVLEFPGLVACRNLTGILPSANPTPPTIADSCQNCPDYCREVPFPSGLPGCDIGACSTCNAGCKIMRQRLDCNSPSVCTSGTCDISCRTRVPVEDKCYFDDADPLAPVPLPANLSVSCGGCLSCPSWCKILIDDPNNPGKKKMRYDDAACNIPACKPPSLGGTCEEQCMYYAPLGPTSDCETSCNACPKYCRIDGLTTDPSMADYDVTDPEIIPLCDSVACNTCNTQCKVSLPASPPPPASCAPYPTASHISGECKDCPTYCRYDDFTFITNRFDDGGIVPYSNVPLQGVIPTVCTTGTGRERLNCAATACDTGCHAIVPDLCREYSAADPNDNYCTKCPSEARITLSYGASPPVLPELKPPFLCDDVSCPSSCKPPNFQLPDNTVLAQCKNYNAGFPIPTAPGVGDPSSCEMCKTGCRLSKADPSIYDCPDVTRLDSTVFDPCAASFCPAECTLQGAHTGDVCSEYLGNAKACLGPSICGAHSTQPDCNAHASEGCSWEADLSLPIDSRNPPYDKRDFCAQCPENCRIITDDAGTLTVYEGSCGVFDPTGEKIDCSISACPLTCRTTVKLNTDPLTPPICRQEDQFGLACEGCPAFCRRENDLPTGTACSEPPFGSACDPAPEAGVSCTSDCRLPDAPLQACSSCLDCPLDCTYYPAVRTDCSEMCSDQALSGPLSIGPDDYYKKLPGAQGELDAKNVGVLLVPALVLPLFCIVIVISFIRVFSPVLGGDIEIPGLSRII